MAKRTGAGAASWSRRRSQRRRGARGFGNGGAVGPTRGVDSRVLVALYRFFGRPGRTSPLPAWVERWVAAQRDRLADGERLELMRPLTAELGGRRCTLRYLPPQGGHPGALIIGAEGGRPTGRSFEALGLSAKRRSCAGSRSAIRMRLSQRACTCRLERSRSTWTTCTQNWASVDEARVDCLRARHHRGLAGRSNAQYAVLGISKAGGHCYPHATGEAKWAVRRCLLAITESKRRGRVAAAAPAFLALALLSGRGAVAGGRHGQRDWHRVRRR